jgi:O-antigen biosynthesis protein WbqP
MINRLVAVLLFILLLPLFILIGIFIYLEDGLPIFFEQKRVGQNCTFFMILKFRTMRLNTPNVATHLLNNPEKYLLKTGKFLRRYSLDELPNIINVISGEMVFVGPRPALFNQEDLMELRIANGVDSLIPGITGWAQINGRDEISLDLKVSLEKDYLDRKSILFDWYILYKTFLKVVNRNNVTH